MGGDVSRGVSIVGSGLDRLSAGQPIPYGGDRVTSVSADLAAAFRSGDRLVVVQETGDLLRVPAAVHRSVGATVGSAVDAFERLSNCTDAQITLFYEEFAGRLERDDTFAPIMRANVDDVESARARGRSTTRLELTPSMRADMVDGLHVWRDSTSGRSGTLAVLDHGSWLVEAERAPLGVVGFVFEGRPNVFADAVGVVRTGNAVVFRIGSDALGTARAIVDHALGPALEAAGLPPGLVGLVDSAERAAGWALFADRRLSLAVARGSGTAVAQLGAVARQSGVPVSLHGTGGAWLVVGLDADPVRFASAVTNSLDRKVCNTLNVCCLPRTSADDLIPVFLDALAAAGDRRGTAARLHVEEASAGHLSHELWERLVDVTRAAGVSSEPFVSTITEDQLGHEWEWEQSPEVSLVVVDDLAHAVRLFNTYSPRFVASLISGDSEEQDRFWRMVDAPFVSDGFTRWVDGQYALDAPELGLSNWEGGRLLGRSAVLSGDAVHTVRLRARIGDPDLRR